MTIALVIIDVQDAILQGLGTPDRQPHIDAALETTIERLQLVQHKARAAGAPIIIVQHDGEETHRLARGSAGWALRKEIAPLPHEVIVHKTSCDSFFETDLAARLQEQSATHLMIGGCMTQFCVDTTARRAVSLGYDVTLLADGHTTADMGALTSSQIIEHHNRLLDGFDAGAHSIHVRRSDEVAF
jgi:nicotinamidase-related amidase